MTSPLKGRYYINRNHSGQAESVVEILGSNRPRWVTVEIRRSPGPGVVSHHPQHFYDNPDDELSITETVDSLEEGLALIPPAEPTFTRVESTMSGWPTKLTAAIEAYENISSSSEAIIQLAERAADRMKIQIQTKLITGE
jgi:hypothetical protein